MFLLSVTHVPREERAAVSNSVFFGEFVLFLSERLWVCPRPCRSFGSPYLFYPDLILLIVGSEFAG